MSEEFKIEMPEEAVILSLADYKKLEKAEEVLNRIATYCQKSKASVPVTLLNILKTYGLIKDK